MSNLPFCLIDPLQWLMQGMLHVSLHDKSSMPFQHLCVIMHVVKIGLALLQFMLQLNVYCFSWVQRIRRAWLPSVNSHQTNYKNHIKVWHTIVLEPGKIICQSENLLRRNGNCISGKRHRSFRTGVPHGLSKPPNCSCISLLSRLPQIDCPPPIVSV